MQAIDVLVQQDQVWTVIELKWEYARPTLVRQMAKYSAHLRRRLPNGADLAIRWVP